MAKTMENGEQVNETLATDTLANLFAVENDKYEIRSGPQNSETADGFEVTLLIPRSYGQHAKAIETFVSSNWNARRGELGKQVSELHTVGEKVAFFERYIADGQWEAKEPSLRSPVEQAVYNRILTASLENGDLKPGSSEKDKDRELSPAVAIVLNDPSKTERGRNVVETYLTSLRDYDRNMTKRNRTTGASETAVEEVSKNHADNF